jgi:hypothetical protein
MYKYFPQRCCTRNEQTGQASPQLEQCNTRPSGAPPVMDRQLTALLLSKQPPTPAASYTLQYRSCTTAHPVMHCTCQRHRLQQGIVVGVLQHSPAAAVTTFHSTVLSVEQLAAAASMSCNVKPSATPGSCAPASYHGAHSVRKYHNCQKAIDPLPHSQLHVHKQAARAAASRIPTAENARYTLAGISTLRRLTVATVVGHRHRLQQVNRGTRSCTHKVGVLATPTRCRWQQQFRSRQCTAAAPGARVFLPVP